MSLKTEKKYQTYILILSLNCVSYSTLAAFLLAQSCRGRQKAHVSSRAPRIGMCLSNDSSGEYHQAVKCSVDQLFEKEKDKLQVSSLFATTKHWIESREAEERVESALLPERNERHQRKAMRNKTPLLKLWNSMPITCCFFCMQPVTPLVFTFLDFFCDVQRVGQRVGHLSLFGLIPDLGCQVVSQSEEKVTHVPDDVPCH